MPTLNVNVPTEIDNNLTASTTRGASKSAINTGLSLKEDLSNKSTDVNTDQASNTKYPSVKAVYDWVIGLGYQTASMVNTLISTALATFKTDNFLDATSSIQTQLNAKDKNYSPIHSSTTITHTGTLTETIIYNTSPNLVGILQTTDHLDLQAIVNASNNGNAKTFSWYISDSQTSLSNQVLIGRHSVGAGWATAMTLQSFLKMKNSLTANSYRDNSVSSLNMNNMYTLALPSINNAGTIDFSSGAKYIIVTVQLSNSADTINVYSIYSQISRP